MSDTLYEMKDDFGDKVEVTTVPGTVTVEFQENKGDGDVAIMDFSAEKIKKLLVLLSKAARDADIIPREEKRKRPHGPQEYRGNGKHAWETAETGDARFTRRLRVPGGWLYKYGENTLVFVPLPEVVGYKI